MILFAVLSAREISFLYYRLQDCESNGADSRSLSRKTVFLKILALVTGSE